MHPGKKTAIEAVSIQRRSMAVSRFPTFTGKIPVSGKPGGYSSILSLPSSFRMCSMASL